MTVTILPPNATKLEKALDTVGGIRIDTLPAPLRTLWSPANCPEDALPWLARTVGITRWDASMPISLRRARVAKGIAIARHMGTVQSLRDVIASYGGIVVKQEWLEQEPKAVPHTFTLQITLGGQVAAPTLDFINSVIADVTATKPERSKFTFTITLNTRATVAIARATRPATFTRLTCREA